MVHKVKKKGGIKGSKRINKRTKHLKCSRVHHMSARRRDGVVGHHMCTYSTNAYNRWFKRNHGWWLQKLIARLETLKVYFSSNHLASLFYCFMKRSTLKVLRKLLF